MIARNSSFTYKGRAVDVKQVNQIFLLGVVAHVIERQDRDRFVPTKYQIRT